jgi:DNA-binding LacI/PurR family transcriptional regulator
VSEKKIKKLSLNDIAELSGVSPATVSRVINDYEHVSPKTRRRVMDVIEKYNYQPNLMARALARQSTQVLGIVIPELVNEVFTDPFFAHMIQNITYSANNHDYDVTLWLTSNNDNSRIVNRILNSSLSDGLIIAEASIDPFVLDLLDKNDKLYMLIGRPALSRPQVNFVDVENFKGGYEITRYLIEKGYRRIGFIPGRETVPAAQDRHDGYLAAVGEANLPDIIGPAGHYTETGAYKSTVYLLQQKVDAIFSGSDLMAVGAIRAIQDNGLHVPADIAVAGFDDMPLSTRTYPALTTMRQPIDVVGRTVAEALIGLLEGEIAPPFQKILPVELIVRQSA